MAMAGACWFLGSVFPGLVFLHRGPLVHLHLSCPIGRLHRRPAAVVVLAAYAAAVYEGFARTPWLTVGLSALFVAAAHDVFARTSGPARRAGRSALAAALVFAGVLALGSANVLLEWGADRAVVLVYDAAVCLVVIWLTVDLLYGRWTEATVSDLVTQLGRRTDTAGLQAQLARALGDPGLTLGYWVPWQHAYVDETGRRLEVDGRTTGRVATAVENDGEPVAVLIHDPGTGRPEAGRRGHRGAAPGRHQRADEGGSPRPHGRARRVTPPHRGGGRRPAAGAGGGAGHGCATPPRPGGAPPRRP